MLKVERKSCLFGLCKCISKHAYGTHRLRQGYFVELCHRIVGGCVTGL